MDKFLSLCPSPSIILYFQTGEDGSAKKTKEALAFLYYNSFISYEYLVSLKFNVSLCRFRYYCFDIDVLFCFFNHFSF